MRNNRYAIHMIQKQKLFFIEFTINVIKCQSETKTNKIISMHNKKGTENTLKIGVHVNIYLNIDIIFVNKFTWGSMTICTLQISDCKH